MISWLSYGRTLLLPWGRRGQIGGALALGLALGLSGAGGGAVAQSMFPPRDGVVANGTSWALSVERINSEFLERLGDPYGLEGLVLVVDSCRPDPEVYLDDAMDHYDLAAGPGQMYDDAVAWLVCQDPRFVGFFWASGNDHAAAFHQDAITAPMAKALGAGNYTGAMTAGIEEAARQIAAAEAPGRTAAGGHAPGGDGAGAAAGQPEDTGGGLPAGALAAAGVVAGGAAVYAYRRRKAPAVPPDRLPARWRELGDRIEALQDRLGGESTDLARVVLAYQGLGDDAILRVHRNHQGMVGRLAPLEERLAVAKAALPTLDDDEAAARYEALEAEAQALEDYADRLHGEAGHAEMLIAKAPVLAVEARKAIAEAAALFESTAQGDRAQAGSAEDTAPDSEGEGPLLPPPGALFAVAEAMADAAEAALTAGERLEAGRRAEEAAEMARRLGALVAAMTAAAADIAAAAIPAEHLEGFAAGSWADVAGNLPEADESLDAAADMLARLAASEVADYGQDSAAGFLASLEAVEGEVARARELTAAVVHRLEQLRRARDRARDTLATVRTEVEAALEWVNQGDVDPDVDAATERALAAAQAQLAEAEGAMAAEGPDWPTILGAIEAADRAADAALSRAREQHQRVGALRRQAESGTTRAEGALARAEGFFSAHRSDLGSEPLPGVQRARDQIDQGREAVARADTVEDTARVAALEDAVAAFDAAAVAADAAYEAMEADFSKAEERRRSYVPRRSWMGPTVPFPIHMRPTAFPGTFGGWGGGFGRPTRRSSWGGGGGGRSRSRPSGGSGRGGSSRRGGGRGW